MSQPHVPETFSTEKKNEKNGNKIKKNKNNAQKKTGQLNTDKEQTQVVSKLSALMLQHKKKTKANVYSATMVHSRLNIQCINRNLLKVKTIFT